MMKAIFRNINLLNLGLIIGCIILLLNLRPMVSYKASIDVKPDSKLAEHEQHQQLKEEPSQNRDIVEYGIIPEKNLFHPERKIIVKAAEAQPSAPPPSSEETPILYGTVVSSKIRLAYLEEKNKKQPPRPLPQAQVNEQGNVEKEQHIFQVGETIGGFTLQEITEDSVILFRGEEKLIVQVFDPSEPKNRIPIAAATPMSPAAKSQPISKPPPRKTPSVAQQIEKKKKEQIMRRRNLLNR